MKLDDIDEFIFKKIKKFTVFTGQFSDTSQDFPILQEKAERIFRTIESNQNAVDFSQPLRNLRIDKLKLRTYF
jgi:hypothetical protein